MGLGPLSRVSLGEARTLATQYREMVRDQIDPILARREEQHRRLLDISIDTNVTFREAVEGFIRAHEPEWRNRTHSQQWGNTLKTYAYQERSPSGYLAIDHAAHIDTGFPPVRLEGPIAGRCQGERRGRGAGNTVPRPLMLARYRLRSWVKGGKPGVGCMPCSGLTQHWRSCACMDVD
nr:Arm DNA-binding domain-containing protein [Burkholderia cepacia]